MKRTWWERFIFLPIKITGGEANGPHAIYCGDCEHMQETITNCGPATICRHPLIQQFGLRAFKKSICTLDKECYLPKLTSFGKLVYLMLRVINQYIVQTDHNEERKIE